MLKKVNRLTKKSDFENVRVNGKFVSSSFFSISLFDRKDAKPSRFGFIVSKKLSTKANIRNKMKRYLREAVQANLKEVKDGFDYVIVARTNALKLTSTEIKVKLKEIIC